MVLLAEAFKQKLAGGVTATATDAAAVDPVAEFANSLLPDNKPSPAEMGDKD